MTTPKQTSLDIYKRLGELKSAIEFLVSERAIKRIGTVDFKTCCQSTVELAITSGLILATDYFNNEDIEVKEKGKSTFRWLKMPELVGGNGHYHIEYSFILE